PIVDAGVDFNTDPGDQVIMQATASGTVSYQWTPAADVSSPTLLVPTANPSVTTTFYLTGTSSDGCITTDSMMVIVKPYDGLTNEDIDNLFTPNGDGKNETWFITEDLTGCSVKVYNTWGNIVFESEAYLNDWDGTYNGDPLPEGAYYYAITCGSLESVTGSVTILRLKK
ncbi:MAG: gliding motility-associated-like protein, partial [Crocinitomicaceae bacterium]